MSAGTGLRLPTYKDLIWHRIACRLRERGRLVFATDLECLIDTA
jgi:hypothetical protein